MGGITSETKEKGETSEQSNRGAAAESEAASETSSAHSGEQSDRKDVDIMTSVLSTRSEEYRLLFRLPPDEVLVQDFNCALQENILLQGHMYLFVHHICFYSNIFGFETKKTIPFQEITCVRKAKTAGLFPTAIEIVMGGKKHFFASFLSRDEAYRLILDGWAQHSSDPKTVLDRQDLKSETSSQDNGFISERAAEFTQLSDDSPASDRNKDANISGDLKLLCNGKNSMEVSLKQSEVKENGEHCDHHQPSVDLLTLQLEDVDAPKIPEYFTMIVEAKFPVQIEDFFRLFISDHAYSFIENFRKSCGDKDFQCTPWRQHEQFVLARDISFMHPVKIPIGAKFGHCQEMQRLRSYRNSHLVIEASQQISNVPYGDYFKVEVIWSVEKNAAEETGCILRVYLNVAFSKKTMFKGKIEQTTRDECREVYQLWIKLARELLQRRNLEKPEVAGDQSTELIQVGLESSSNVEVPSENFDAEASTMITPILSARKNFNSDINSPLQEIWGIFSSTFRYFWEMLCSYFKSQSHQASTLLLAFAATLVLMQICIVALLTRAPQVHLVTQGNYMSSTSSYSLENTDWLEKRFNHLKEEMLMLEIRMERMRHEYAFLKGYLQSLEQLKSHS